MSTSLSSLVDNLSELYGEKCQDKNCKCECELIGLKNNRLQYKCKECKKGQLKQINGLIKKGSQIHMNFLMETLINLFCYYENVFVHMNT